MHFIKLKRKDVIELLLHDFDFEYYSKEVSDSLKWVLTQILLQGPTSGLLCQLSKVKIYLDIASFL